MSKKFVIILLLLITSVSAEILEGGAFRIIPSVGGGGNVSGGAFNVIPSIKGRLIYNSTLPQGLNLPPTFSNPINASVDFKKYSNFTANITITDITGLNYSIFSTNMSGAWVNDTPTLLNGLTSFRFNTTKNITVGYPNTTCWKVFANDTLGLIGESSIYCFEVVAEAVIVPPGGGTGGQVSGGGRISNFSFIILNEFNTSYIHWSYPDETHLYIWVMVNNTDNSTDNITLTYYLNSYPAAKVRMIYQYDNIYAVTLSGLHSGDSLSMFVEGVRTFNGLVTERIVTPLNEYEMMVFHPPEKTYVFYKLTYRDLVYIIIIFCVIFLLSLFIKRSKKKRKVVIKQDDRKIVIKNSFWKKKERE